MKRPKIKFERITSADEENIGKLPHEKTVAVLRRLRVRECFSAVNRGEVWYNLLTNEQKEELKTWYQAWLDVTESLSIPEKPVWLK